MQKVCEMVFQTTWHSQEKQIRLPRQRLYSSFIRYFSGSE